MGKALPTRGEISRRSDSNGRSETTEQNTGRTITSGGNWKPNWQVRNGVGTSGR